MPMKPSSLDFSRDSDSHDMYVCLSHPKIWLCGSALHELFSIGHKAADITVVASLVSIHRESLRMRVGTWGRDKTYLSVAEGNDDDQMYYTLSKYTGRKVLRDLQLRIGDAVYVTVYIR